MALVRVLYDNKGLSATWSALTDVATLPAANLGTANRRRACRTTGVASQWFKANLGSAQAVGAVAIVSPNITQAADITIQGNAADAWGAPTFTQVLAPWDYAKSGVLVAWFAAQTLAWWRVVIDDPTNPDGYLQVGLIALGPSVAFARAPQDLRFTRVDPSPVEYAPSGTPYTLDLDPYAVVEVAHRHEAASLLFGDLHTALATLLKRDGVLSVYGDGPGSSDVRRALNLYGRLAGPPAFSHAADAPGELFSADSLTFRESL